MKIDDKQFVMLKMVENKNFSHQGIIRKMVKQIDRDSSSIAQLFAGEKINACNYENKQLVSVLKKAATKLNSMILDMTKDIFFLTDGPCEEVMVEQLKKDEDLDKYIVPETKFLVRMTSFIEGVNMSVDMLLLSKHDSDFLIVVASSNKIELAITRVGEEVFGFISKSRTKDYEGYFEKYREDVVFLALAYQTIRSIAPTIDDARFWGTQIRPGTSVRLSEFIPEPAYNKTPYTITLY